MNHRHCLLAAGILGATGVGLGASGAHGPLHDALAARGMANTWETAVRYQLLHAVALIAVGAWSRNAGGKLVGWAARGLTVGTILFSGSLYWLCFGGPRWLGPVTPLGGVALIAGWLCLAAAALAKPAGS